MQPRKILMGTIGYVLITFPLAYVWHLVLFQATYNELGYFSRDEPIIVFGFMSILIQGFILSFIYPLLCADKSFVQGLAPLVAVMGVYHWTMHVLAESAKHPIEPLSTWFALETAYLAIQFGLGGCACLHLPNTSFTCEGETGMTDANQRMFSSLKFHPRSEQQSRTDIGAASEDNRWSLATSETFVHRDRP